MTPQSHTTAQSIREVFNPPIFETARKLWFQNVTDDTQLILPPSNLIKQWFTSDTAFDAICSENFSKQLDFIRTESNNGLTATDLLSALAPLRPLDWLGLILLLDQVPRNCFRGQDAKIAFSVFDPITIGVVMRAIEEGTPMAPELRYRVGYQLWFYLPLQHSERRDIQELSMRKHAEIFEDVRALMDEPTSGGKDSVAEGVPAATPGMLKRDQIRDFLVANREGVERWQTMLVGFAARHKAVIDRFGRYPHRNEALGRESTDEEIKYLAEGGETFSSSKEHDRK